MNKEVMKTLSEVEKDINGRCNREWLKAMDVLTKQFEKLTINDSEDKASSSKDENCIEMETELIQLFPLDGRSLSTWATPSADNICNYYMKPKISPRMAYAQIGTSSSEEEYFETTKRFKRQHISLNRPTTFRPHRLFSTELPDVVSTLCNIMYYSDQIMHHQPMSTTTIGNDFDTNNNTTERGTE